MNIQPAHPSSERLQAFLNGLLPAADQQEVEAHVSDCDHCCAVLESIPAGSIGQKLRMMEALTRADDLAETLPVNDTDAAEDNQIPRDLLDHPRYRLVKQLGAGGMGVVYQAQHRLMNRSVALKVIKPVFIRNQAAVKRFQLEVRCAAQLNHRNIVTAHDAEQAGSLHFLVMEFIDGVSLAQLVTKRGALSPLHACNYTMQAALGLQHAYEQNMVHRDIKPQNLMRSRGGTIKILDFGLARFASQRDEENANSGLTSDGAQLGTPDYMAPEQARDPRQADIRADVYSLGCTMYYLLSGQVPFPGGTSTEKIVAHCEDTATPLDIVCDDVPTEVIAIVERMMAKDPADRFQTPGEVVEAIKPYGKPRSAAVTDAPPPAPTVSDDNPLFSGAEPTDPHNAPVMDAPSVFPAASYPSAMTAPPRGGWSRWWKRNQRRLMGGGISFAVVAVIVAAGFLIAPFISDKEDWIDLIARCDGSHPEHAIGGWRKEGQELIAQGTAASRLNLDYRPPAEYDLEIEFTRESGEDSVAIVFVAGKRQATFEVDAWRSGLAGIQNIDGGTMKTNPTRRSGVQLQNNRRYKMLVKVRRLGADGYRVDGYLGRRRLATFRGDPAQLSLMADWNIGDAGTVGVGAFNGTTRFHRILIRPRP